MPPAGRGRVLITSQNPIWPPGQALEVPVLDTEVAAGFLVDRTGDPDRAGCRGAGRVSWAGCRWRWSRPPPTSRPPGTAWPGTWPCSGSGGRTCWPAASPPGTARRWRPPGRWRSPGWSGPRRGRRAVAAAGVLRARGGPAAAAAATPARARRTSWARRWREVLVPLLEDRAGGRRCGRGAAPVFAGQPRPGTGRCRCTGWCRRSPPIRCPRNWPQRGGRPPPP